MRNLFHENEQQPIGPEDRRRENPELDESPHGERVGQLENQGLGPRLPQGMAPKIMKVKRPYPHLLGQTDEGNEVVIERCRGNYEGKNTSHGGELDLEK